MAGQTNNANDKATPKTGAQGTQTKPGFDTTSAMEQELAQMQQEIQALQTTASYNGPDDTKNALAQQAVGKLAQLQAQYRDMLTAYTNMTGQKIAYSGQNAPPTDQYIYTRDANGNLVATPNQNFNQASHDLDNMIKENQLKSDQIDAAYKAHQIGVDDWYKQHSLLNEQFARQMESQMNAVRAADSINTANGQALNAETSRFDRIFTTAGDIADAAVRGPLLPSILQATAPLGDLQDLSNIESKMASGDFSPTKFGAYHYPLPFNPQTIGTDIAMAALNKLAPAASKLNSTGAFQPASTGYEAPKTPQQVLANASPVSGIASSPPDPGTAQAATATAAGMITDRNGNASAGNPQSANNTPLSNQYSPPSMNPYNPNS